MNLSALSIEEREKLKEYLNSVQEIQSEINLMLEKAGCRLKESSVSTIGDPNNKSNGLKYKFSDESPKVSDESPEDGF
jgi:hypothetical protein